MNELERTVKIYYNGDANCARTAPIVMKPVNMTRRQWREIRLKAMRMVKKKEKEMVRGAHE